MATATFEGAPITSSLASDPTCPGRDGGAGFSILPWARQTSAVGVQDDAERLEPTAVDEWSGWLAAHHGDRRGVWVVMRKKGTGRPGIDYETAAKAARGERS